MESIYCFKFVLFSDLYSLAIHWNHSHYSTTVFFTDILFALLCSFTHDKQILTEFQSKHIYDFPQPNQRSWKILCILLQQFSVYAAIRYSYKTTAFVSKDMVNKHEGEKKPINFKRCTRFWSVVAIFFYFSVFLWCWIFYFMDFIHWILLMK